MDTNGKHGKAQVMDIDNDKLQAFLGKVIEDYGAALSSALAYIGQKLGLYQAMADAGWLSPEELAKRTNTSERYVREWLINQAAGGYIEYDMQTERYMLSPEHAIALTDETSPFFVGGGFYVVKAMLSAQTRIAEAFRTGAGMRWDEHDPDLFIGTERFFRPGYAAHLTSEWIPALNGVEAKLNNGGYVADVGCGHGASTIIMAQAYPKSRFWGFDTHKASVDHAKKSASGLGLSSRVHFEVSDARNIANHGYDLVAFFDCLHDMGDPVGALRRARETLSSSGSVLVVEPMAGAAIEENFNPLGRTFSAASTLCCTANSLAFGGLALGAIASDETLRRVAMLGGLTQFRRAAETPFNRIFEARP